MKNNCLFAMALLSLALAGGCAKGGNGTVPVSPSISVTITSPSDLNAGDIYPTQTVTLTATVSNSTNTAVTWSLSGSGTLTPVTPATTPATATYAAPATAGSQATVTTTLVADSSVTGILSLGVVDITTEIAPAALSVGSGLTQQFTAIALPDDAPQTFTWTCTANGVSCADFHQDSNVSGLAYYTANDSCSGSCVQISAAAPLDPAGCSPNPKYCTIAKASLVTSRVSGTYAFRFSGYDSSNNATAVVGTFTASNGTIASGGVEYELTSSGRAEQSIAGGLYTPTSSDPNNSNNAGTLTLTLPAGVYPNQYQVVLDGAGDIEMIESDGHGTGSGIARKSNASLFTGTTDQTFAFGFTGVDSSGKRVGYVGLLPMNGSGTIVGGQMDVNDNGNATDICGAGPCSITNATYTADGSVSGLWHITLTAGSAAPMIFDFFVASTTASTANPLTFYAITDPADTTNPAVSGTMVLQDFTQTYNIAAFKGTSVSALTGVNGANTNVSLTLGTTDGSGNFLGQFDQNNAGTILSGVQFPPTTGTNNYTYAASSTNNGRYTFNMLGNPTASSVVAPLPFILYAGGQNRGFLLDQSSSSVMTGTMNPQGQGGGGFANSELPGTFAAATTNSGSSAVTPIAANLLLTIQTASAGALTYNVFGTQYPAGPTQPVNGAYTLSASGAGTISLTTPFAQKYAIYVLDTSGCNSAQNPVCAIQDFLMIDEDTTNPDPSIIFAKE
jgi:hypothetical protein